MHAKTTRIANIILITTLSVAGLYFAAPFLIPVVLAGLLAMLLSKGVERLEKLGFGRALSALVPVLLFVGAIVLLGVVLSWQIDRLADNFAEIREGIDKKMASFREWVSDNLGVTEEKQQQMFEQQGKATSTQAGGFFFALVNTLADTAVNAILVIVYTYLLIFYRSHLKKFVLRTVPPDNRRQATRIVRKSVAVSGQYLTGLFNMVGVLWVMYSIGFSIVGLEGAILFALICGLLEIVPFFGNFVGNLIAVLAAIAQGGDAKMIIGVIVVYLTVQFLQTYILEPLVVGQKVNINPLFTIAGLVVGELLWGIAGMALAIPLIAIVKIICDNVPELQAYGELIGPADKPKKMSLFASLKKRFQRE